MGLNEACTQLFEWLQVVTLEGAESKVVHLPLVEPNEGLMEECQALLEQLIPRLKQPAIMEGARWVTSLAQEAVETSQVPFDDRAPALKVMGPEERWPCKVNVLCQLAFARGVNNLPTIWRMLEAASKADHCAALEAAC